MIACVRNSCSCKGVPHDGTTTPTSAGTLPKAGTYTLDASHADVGFKVRHLMVSKVRGAFSDVTATLTVADEPTDSSVEVQVGLASIDTRDEQRDAHLRSPDFFDVERYETMTFQSTAVRHLGRDRWEIVGDLSLHGVTGAGHPRGHLRRLGDRSVGQRPHRVHGIGELDRETFGLTWNAALETGGVVVGKQVQLEIEAEFVKA